MNPFTLKKPLITEKTYRLVQEDHVFTFEVDLKATKGQIKEAVEETFGVKVLSVRTARVAGKVKRTGKKRVASITAGRKKAMVKLPKEQTIELFEIKN